MIKRTAPDHLVDAILALLFPCRKRRCEFIVTGDTVGQQGGILDCHRGSLGGEWCHGVSCIADERGGFCSPCPVRIDAVQRPRRPGSGRIHKLLEFRRSVAHGLREDFDVCVAGPAVGYLLAFGESNEIDLRTSTNWIGDQVETAVEESRHGVSICDTCKCLSGGLVECNCGAPCQFSGEPAGGSPSYRAANRRPDTVGSNKQSCADFRHLASAIHRSFNTSRVLLHVGYSCACREFDPVASAGCSQQGGLEIRPMDNEVKCLPAPLGCATERYGSECLEGACAP